MPHLFVGNFDFEHRLACGGGTLPRHLERLNAEFCPVWAAVAEEGDVVWTPIPIAPAVFERLAALGLPRLWPVTSPSVLPAWYETVFWGENDWTIASARRWCLRRDGCDPAIVRKVNSRVFKYDLERRLGVILPGAGLVRTLGELAVALARLDSTGWVLKGEFGGAGREVRFGVGGPTVIDLAWAQNRFRRGLAVAVEPRLDPIDEAGLQFDVGRNGDVELVGITPLFTRQVGGYLASSFADDPALPQVWSEAVEVGFQAAKAVAAEGYIGPVGVDAMRYRGLGGTVHVRPLQDLNARWTMGRLALGLRRYPAYALASGELFRPSDFQAEVASIPGVRALARV